MRPSAPNLLSLISSHADIGMLWSVKRAMVSDLESRTACEPEKCVTETHPQPCAHRRIQFPNLALGDSAPGAASSVDCACSRSRPENSRLMWIMADKQHPQAPKQLERPDRASSVSSATRRDATLRIEHLCSSAGSRDACTEEAPRHCGQSMLTPAAVSERSSPRCRSCVTSGAPWAEFVQSIGGCGS